MYGTDDPELYILVLTIINIMNFMDRGIIPGATDEFTSFVDDALDTNSPSLYIGLLQSSFIIGICIASPVFATLAHTQNTFSLILSGMIVWTISALVSGASKYVNSYEVLLIGRMLSGVGEAAFMCCTSPWIATNAPSVSKSKWLAIFYSAMPVGTALGYIYSSILATSIGWQWAFFIEAGYMFPFLCFLYSMSLKFPLLRSGERHLVDKSLSREVDNGGQDEDDLRKSLLEDVLDDGEDALDRLGSVCSSADIGLMDDQIVTCDGEVGRMSDKERDPPINVPPTFMEETLIVLNNPCYVYITLGYAALTGVLIGMATFGSSFFMALNYFDSEVGASTAFGALVSVAGIIGFPLGGLIVDKMVKKHKKECLISGGTSEYADLIMTSLVMTLSGTAALGLYAVLYVVRASFLFFTVIFVATTAVFVCNASTSVGLIYSIPIASRPFGIAFNAIVMHLLGDVPSPLVAGVLKDHFAHGCVGDDDQASTSDACRDDAAGIRLVMLLLSTWLVWCTLFYGLSYKHSLHIEKLKNDADGRLYNSDRKASLLKGNDSLDDMQ